MNALWGKGERDGARRATRRPRASVFAALVAVFALALPVTAGAGNYGYTPPDLSYVSTDDSLYYSDEDLALLDAAWESAAWADAAWHE